MPGFPNSLTTMAPTRRNRRRTRSTGDAGRNAGTVHDGVGRCQPVPPLATILDALTHLQLRGASGTIVATDGRHLLTQSGFPFPWQEDVLVPASTVFGCKEVQGLSVQLGRTETHVVLGVGPWRFFLPIDRTGRYPHTDEVIPRSSKVASTAVLNPDDITYLVRALPRLPGGNDDDAPVTIDFGEVVHIRAAAQGQANLTDLALSRSTCTGESVRFRAEPWLPPAGACVLGFRSWRSSTPTRR